MTDAPPPMALIVTNPMLSGRSFKMMVIGRNEDGALAHDPEVHADITLQDGMTTIVTLNPGDRLVVREAQEAPLTPVMVGHDVVKGTPAAPADTVEFAAPPAPVTESGGAL